MCEGGSDKICLMWPEWVMGCEGVLIKSGVEHIQAVRRLGVLSQC